MTTIVLRKGRTGKENLTLAPWNPLYFVTLWIRQAFIGPPFPTILIFSAIRGPCHPGPALAYATGCRSLTELFKLLVWRPQPMWFTCRRSRTTRWGRYHCSIYITIWDWVRFYGVSMVLQQSLREFFRSWRMANSMSLGPLPAHISRIVINGVRWHAWYGYGMCYVWYLDVRKNHFSFS